MIITSKLDRYLLLGLVMGLITCGKDQSDSYVTSPPQRSKISFTPTSPPQGEELEIAWSVAQRLSKPDLAYEAMKNVNVIFVSNRFDVCPNDPGVMACFDEHNIFLEGQRYYYNECWLLAHEFAHAGLLAIDGIQDIEHKGLGANSWSDYFKLSNDICAKYSDLKKRGRDPERIR